MKKVGLTGGIGSGKSTAAQIFKGLDVPIIDADVIAHDLAKTKPVLEQIKEKLGPEFITNKGELDRAALKTHIFNHPSAKDTLEAILHPLINQTILDQVKKLKEDYCIIVIPLLVENQDKYNWLDKIIVVDVAPEIQIQRTTQRDDMTEALAKQIMASQAPRAIRVKAADMVLDNNQDFAYLEGQVFDCHQMILKDAIKQ